MAMVAWNFGVGYRGSATDMRRYILPWRNCRWPHRCFPEPVAWMPTHRDAERDSRRAARVLNERIIKNVSGTGCRNSCDRTWSQIGGESACNESPTYRSTERVNTVNITVVTVCNRCRSTAAIGRHAADCWLDVRAALSSSRRVEKVLIEMLRETVVEQRVS